MKTKTKRLLVIGIPVILLGVGIALFLLLSSPAGKDHPSKNPDGTQTITLAQYEKIENGLSYAQVKGLLGVDGTLKSETGEKGSGSYLAVYIWKGSKTDTTAVVVLQGDKVLSKSQVGLE